MRIALLCICLVSLAPGCRPQQRQEREALPWVVLEDIPRDSRGRVTAAPRWQPPIWTNRATADTFVVFGTADSVLMISNDGFPARMFVPTDVGARHWKPRPSIGRSLRLMGTYERRDLRGIFQCFYITADRRNLLQVWYTNPGNVMDALLFSKDSSNILEQEHLVIDPRADMSEAESAVPAR
jgi:hypothetical protein